MDSRLIAFARLLQIMDELRERCHWDQKQTFETLRNLTIEETYEMADAITEKDYAGLEGELGDLFLHLIFYSKIGSEQGLFDVESVLHKICDKLIYRHPHIYGNTEAKDEETVKANWEKLKLKEDEDGNKISDVMGIRSACKVMKTRYAKPFEGVQVKIPYSTGMSPYSGMVDLAEKKGLLKKDGNRLAFTTADGEIIKQFRKAWEQNEGGCLDRIMTDFKTQVQEVSSTESTEEEQ